jgi:methanogenic corrinoid protein MtbC1
MIESIEEFRRRVIELVPQFRRQELVDLISEGLSQGIAPRDVQQVLFSSIRQACRRFDRGDIYFPEFFLTINTVQAGMNTVLPRLKSSAEQSKFAGKVVLGVVEGDIHDIGKNIVKMILDSEGIRVIDLGINVSADRFIQVAKEEAAPVIAASTLMSSTLCKMEELETKLQKQGLKGKIWTIIGGRATSAGFANSIGADAWAEEAIEGVNKIKQYLQIRSKGP